MNKGNKGNKGYLFLSLVLMVASLLSSVLIHKLVVSLQTFFFDKKGSILFTTSLGLWIALPMILLFFIIFCLSSMLLSKYNKNTPKNFRLRLDKNERSIIKNFFLISGTLILLSFFNYCAITESGIFFRDIRTGFFEKFYTWKQVESIDIESYKDSRSSSANLRMVIVFCDTKVNITNTSWYTKNWPQRLRKIYKVAQKNNIHIAKEIDYIDEYNQQILNYIENGY